MNLLQTHDPWIEAISRSVLSCRRSIDSAVEQLTDSELMLRPTPELNSVAIILRHIGGNLKSRWTDFLATDGEKPDRNRDSEFEDWEGDRKSLIEFFDVGWKCLESAIGQLDASNISRTIYVRGEPHTIPDALTRSVTHLAWHVGQLMMIARTVHEGPWKWLTIAPGESQQHNQATWGTPDSRSVMGRPPAER